MLKITAVQKIIEANNRIKVDKIKAEIDKMTQDWLEKNGAFIDMIMTGMLKFEHTPEER